MLRMLNKDNINCRTALTFREQKTHPNPALAIFQSLPFLILGRLDEGYSPTIVSSKLPEQPESEKFVKYFLHWSHDLPVTPVLH